MICIKNSWLCNSKYSQQVGRVINPLSCYPDKIYIWGNKGLSLIIFRFPWFFLQRGSTTSAELALGRESGDNKNQKKLWVKQYIAPDLNPKPWVLKLTPSLPVVSLLVFSGDAAAYPSLNWVLYWMRTRVHKYKFDSNPSQIKEKIQQLPNKVEKYHSPLPFLGHLKK